MLEKLNDLKADEVDLKFGLVTPGEPGKFAIGKVGVEANYEVTLISRISWRSEVSPPRWEPAYLNRFRIPNPP